MMSKCVGGKQRHHRVRGRRVRRRLTPCTLSLAAVRKGEINLAVNEFLARGARTAEVAPLTSSKADSSEGEKERDCLENTDSLSERDLKNPAAWLNQLPASAYILPPHISSRARGLRGNNGPHPSAAQASIIAFRVRRYVSLSQHALQRTQGYSAVSDCGHFLFIGPTKALQLSSVASLCFFFSDSHQLKCGRKHWASVKNNIYIYEKFPTEFECVSSNVLPR